MCVGACIVTVCGLGRRDWALAWALVCVMDMGAAGRWALGVALWMWVCRVAGVRETVCVMSIGDGRCNKGALVTLACRRRRASHEHHQEELRGCGPPPVLRHARRLCV